MSDSKDSNDGEDEDVAERALREGLRTPALSPEAMQRIRAATQAEWRANVQAPAQAACANAAGCRWLLPPRCSCSLRRVGWNVFMTNSGENGAMLGAARALRCARHGRIRIPAA